MSDTLFYGGDIVTMAGNGPDSVPPQALLVRGGQIACVGALDEARAQAAPGAREIDLQGRCLLPAFIDAHGHIVNFADSLRFVSLADARSFEDIKRLLRDFKTSMRIAPAAWVVGFGYDHNFLKEHAHPDRAMLDDALSENPVIISHASGHMGVANSLALAATGIDATAPDPAGGLIGREADGKTPNGYLEEKAFMAIGAKLPGPSRAELKEALDRAQDIYLSYGITTAQEGIAKAREIDALKGARLKMDVVAYVDMKECPEILRSEAAYVGTYQDGFKIGGYKIFLDGSPQGRTAWMTKPYLGVQKDYVGYPIYTDEQVRAFVKKAREAHAQLLCHCNGDAAAAQFITAHEEPAAYRDVMIHAQLAREDQLPAMKEMGIIPSFFVAHTYYWGDTHVENFGMERAERISPAKAALEAGLPFTFHMDTPVLAPNMLDVLYCAMNRVTRSGVTLGADQRLTAWEALLGVTRNAAYQYFEEDSKGTLEAGKRADLVVLSANPLKTPKEQMRSVQVVETYKDGVCVYQKG